ncbi:MAG TPA: hypothetical protein ENI23_16140 [bacterium]|nr:hypothetical protein [bacterium]
MILVLDDKAIEDLKYFLKPISDFIKAVDGDDIAPVADPAPVGLRSESDVQHSLDPKAEFMLMDARRIRELYVSLNSGEWEEVLKILNERKSHWT